MATRVGAVRTNQYAAEVTSTGYQASDGFSVVLVVPAAELVAGHDYAAVITGVCGAFWHREPTNRWQSAEVTARLGPSTFPFLNLSHTQDGRHTPWQAVYDPFARRWLSGLRGLPFQIIYRFTQPNPSVDFNVVARLKTNSASHPGGSLLLGNATAILWDLTQIDATGGMSASRQSYAGSNYQIPYVNETLVRPITALSAPAAGTYLLYHSALLTGRNPNSNDRIGLDNTASQLFDRPVGNAEFGNPNPLVTTVWLGQQGVRDLAQSEQVSQWTQAIYSAPATKGLYHHGELLAIRLHADQQLFREPTGALALVDFWAQPFQGTPVGPKDFSVVYSSDFFMWGHAGQTVPEGAALPMLELDGGEFRGSYLYAIPGAGGPVPNCPAVHCANPQLHGHPQGAPLGGRLLGGRSPAPS